MKKFFFILFLFSLRKTMAEIDWLSYLKKERPRLILNHKVVSNVKNLIEENQECKKNLY
ncbi:MAG: hypothetical protein NC917_03865 [Candidatus Omnitrophica bacterium]|nr:hypothetical protein [Candidatus Omnitrophota bacterium]